MTKSKRYSGVISTFLRTAIIGLVLTIPTPPTPVSASTKSSTIYSETVLHSFAGTAKDGAVPYAPVIRDSAGNLYGTTYYGGARSTGILFRLTSRGVENLYSFPASNGNSAASLVADGKGSFYGTTTYNFGTVFKVTATGQVTILHSFQGPGGLGPSAGVVIDSKGNLYGTTRYGGKGCFGLGCGVVFELSPPAVGKKKWTEKVIYTFMGKSDGAGPSAGLVFDTAGNLYGTTTYGGDVAACPGNYGDAGCGVVFKLTPSGSTWQENVLYTFTNGLDGGFPQYGSLVQDSQGNLYGTTYAGGASGLGAVFRVTPTGQETPLYSFTGQNSDGLFPLGGVILDAQGNIYGTTNQGGSGFGIVYSISPSGAETILHTFAGTSGSDGAYPSSGLVFDSNGILYGTTGGGGKFGSGTVFKLTPQ
jgi:uncharacterized repeat protein (TIGR03803 family)